MFSHMRSNEEGEEYSLRICLCVFIKHVDKKLKKNSEQLSSKKFSLKDSPQLYICGLFHNNAKIEF